MIVRDAAVTDMSAVREIYTHYVLNGLATFEEVAPDGPEMVRRLASAREAGFPYLVAELDGRVVGYSYGSTYRPRPAYRFTIEDSVYVAEDAAGQGVGSALLAELISRCEAGPWQQMVAVIGNSANTGSIKLHEKFGFEHVGTLRSVGFKLDQWVDTVLMQRAIGRTQTVGEE